MKRPLSLSKGKGPRIPCLGEFNNCKHLRPSTLDLRNLFRRGLYPFPGFLHARLQGRLGTSTLTEESEFLYFTATYSLDNEYIDQELRTISVFQRLPSEIVLLTYMFIRFGSDPRGEEINRLPAYPHWIT